VEALVALSITALAGAVLLLSVESSLDNTTAAVEQTIADGLAQQLLDEVMTKRYHDPTTTPLSTDLGANSFERSGNGRERYNDTDDYHGYVAAPLVGIWGKKFGTGDDVGGNRPEAFRLRSGYLDHWRARVLVYYVDPTDPSIKLTSNPDYYRAVEVHIEYLEPDGTVRSLASRKRVIAYVPPHS
jgi:hypothetical protein